MPKARLLPINNPCGLVLEIADKSKSLCHFTTIYESLEEAFRAPAPVLEDAHGRVYAGLYVDFASSRIVPATNVEGLEKSMGFGGMLEEGYGAGERGGFVLSGREIGLMDVVDALWVRRL